MELSGLGVAHEGMGQIGLVRERGHAAEGAHAEGLDALQHLHQADGAGVVLLPVEQGEHAFPLSGVQAVDARGHRPEQTADDVVPRIPDNQDRPVERRQERLVRHLVIPLEQELHDPGGRREATQRVQRFRLEQGRRVTAQGRGQPRMYAVEQRCRAALASSDDQDPRRHFLEWPLGAPGRPAPQAGAWPVKALRAH